MKYYEDIIFSEEKVRAFADLSGDKNPIHLDSTYANTTIFKEPIVHGLFASSIFSKILGMYLPGPGTIYLKQNIEFIAPIYFDTIYVGIVEVLNIDITKSKISLSTLMINKLTQKICIQGDAIVKNKQWVSENQNKM